MAKDEKGFMDWLVEDICNTIEIKGAVEATRDENGKVDKWAATGLAMGLGHTSDDEMATLAGFLGAEGAFDDDTVDIDDDTYIPPIEIDSTPDSAFEHDWDAIEKDREELISLRNDSQEEVATEINPLFKGFEALMTPRNNSTEDDCISETEDDEEEFEDTFIGTNLVYADDMKLLSEAGYDEFDLDLMEPEELKEAMEDAGVDTLLYDFE